MAKNNVRVEIPGDPSELIALAAKIEKKHVDLGTASPLRELEDVATFGPAVARAAEHDGKADEYEGKRETEIGERNKDVPNVRNGTRTRRDLLLAVFASNPKKLTEWGFNVSEGGTGGGDATKPAPGK